MEGKKEIDISMGVIFRAALLILAIWLVYLIRDILALFFIAILLTAAIDPAVDWMQRKKIPRSAGVILIYAILFSAIGLSISLLIPPLVSQSREFSRNSATYSRELDSLKVYLEAHNMNFGFFNISDSRLSNLSETLFSQTIGIFSSIISIFVILVTVFYMAVKEDGIKRFIVSVTPEKHKKYAASLTERIEYKIGKWVQGQLFLMLIIFVLDFVGLAAIGIPYALALALFAGLMEIIPYVGPIISAIPGIILGFLISPLAGMLALLVYFLAQEIEAHIIVPQVMKKAVGLNPVTVILALLVGFQLSGVLGAILAVPLATMASVFIGDLMKNNI